MSRLVLFVGIFAAPVYGEAPQPTPVYSPEEQLESFRFAEPGYRIELVASDPMVQDPVAISFDGKGRLWVVEMRGYMRDIDRSGVNDPIGRISVLEDLDQDGRMDKGTVFLDQLILPRSIAIHPDGVLVAESKPLWFVKDKDGDLVADEKLLIDPNYARDSIEHSANGLLRGMDNWIYNAKEGHRYRREGNWFKREPTELRGQWGICQDDRGRLFYNYNHSQLHADLVPPNSLSRNPNHQPSSGLSVGVTSSNAVFPIRSTRATNRGYIPGALDEDGRIKEFTSACAPFIYRESLFPEFSGDAFVCGTAGNLIKRNVLKNDGLQVSGVPAYEGRDFLASTDERFRPCWITTGPDGAMYISDMYRGIIQDGPHMSPYLRQHSIAHGMEKPIHLGRIWRIVPEEFGQPESPDFSKMGADELVKHLAHEGGWWRDQAQMHLVERKLTEAVPNLRNIALKHNDSSARLHALWTLEGLKSPEPHLLLPAFRDRSPTVQAAALRVALSLGLPHKDLADQIEKLSDTNPGEELTLQMILTLGDLHLPEERMSGALAKILLPNTESPIMRDAALSSLKDRELHFLTSIWDILPEEGAVDSGTSFLIESLSQAVIRSRKVDSIGSLLSMLDSRGLDWRQQALLAGVEVLGFELDNDPVSLARVPSEQVQEHGNIRKYFTWPGHTPSQEETPEVRPLKQNEQAWFARGRQVYLTSCVACHGADGKGMKLIAPPLAGSDWVTGSDERLSRVLFHGLSGPITVSGKRYAAPDIQPVMPPLATLGNQEISAVLTYIRREWGNAADPISPGRISRLRIAAQGRTIPWTEKELLPFAKLRQPAGPDPKP